MNRITDSSELKPTERSIPKKSLLNQIIKNSNYILHLAAADGEFQFMREAS